VSSDVPSLMFVDPSEADSVFRVILWGAPGEGKSVAAASAPAPIVVVSADRPGAYRFARRHHKGKDIREVRYENTKTLDDVLDYIRKQPEVRTVVLDPFGGIYDRIVDQAPKRADGDVDYQKVNKRVLDFLYALRDVDVNLIIVAHEKLNDGKRGDGKLYPACGGPSLINKVVAESDIVARVYRDRPSEGPVRFMAQLQPAGNVVCKDSTPGGLGETRELDLAEWFAVSTDDSDLPWSNGGPEAEGPLPDEELAQQEQLGMGSG
jgi:hypothetical protein